MTQERDVLEVDVLFVGGGIASLSSALHLSKLIREHNAQESAAKLPEVAIAVIDKGFGPGAHGISGAVMDPGPLKDLVPDFLEQAPLEGEVKKESIYFLTEKGKIKTPITPPPLNNHGNYVVSVSKLNSWLAGLVEENGVDIFWGFPGVEVLYGEDGAVTGVRTGDKGIDAKGEKKTNYEPGADIQARVTVFGEGSRGNLTKRLIADLDLAQGKNPPAFEVGVKEVWELPDARLEPGEVVHTMGYPLPSNTFGGGFLYGMKDNMAAVGQLISLDYSDPFTDPHKEFQKFKLHPLVSGYLEGGKLVQYGAKTVPVGGLFSIPKVAFPGGVLIGDGANLFNSQKIKGIDLAIRSGMLAAQTIFEGLVADDLSPERLTGYEKALLAGDESKGLRKVRNFHQAMTRGLYRGMATAVGQYLFGGKVLADRLPSQPDHTHMKSLTSAAGAALAVSSPAAKEVPFDGKLTFDKETDVYYSGATHEEAQPAHLKVKDLDICYGKCSEHFQNPCVKFCPAGVYEMVTDESTGAKTLKINFSNCVHCKTCDIKDPFENIEWVPPEGEGGPKYTVM